MARTLPSQPEVNIGLVGHVDHGKTTLTQALSGVWTDTHSEERRRGISIKLGYADTAFYKTDSGQYYATGRRPEGGKDVDSELQRVVSFVDAPGHETLMAIMITGASIMDGAMLMVAANETCPQPQTREHLMALEIAGIKNIVIVQNKIDLVTKDRAMESYKEINEFLKGTIAQNAPIIPVSAHHDVNLDVLIEAIEQTIPTPNRQDDERAVMHIARSFDVNRPGTRPAKLTGGVIGGSIVEGAFKEGDEIIIGPGRKIEQGNKTRWEPIETTITSMQGGVLAGISRVLAGEPFFLNSFKNIANDGREGYIALAGRREGDKIIVLDLERFGGEILCARDSYLCSKGQVSIDAATTFTRGQMGLRLFLSNQNTIFMQKLSGTGLACISGNGTVIRQDLEEGQEMVVDARAVCAFSKTIGYQLRLMSSPLAALFGGEGLFFARLSGPGTFYLQSLPAARQDGGLRDEGEVAV